MKIGFVGLGIMGRPMAMHLKDAGHAIHVPDRASLAPEIRAAATVLPDARAVAQASEVVILMVPDTPDVEAALFAPGGVAEGLSPGKLVIDMSSAFDRARPLFEAMGKNITLVGEENGAGQTCKVANQIVVALTIEAVAEALVFAAKAGTDPAKVRQALMGGLATSRILELHGERMIARKFEPGFRIKLHQKDLNLALQAGRDLGVALPNTASTQQLFSACVAAGGGDWDHSGLVRALETMAAGKVAPDSA